MIKLNLLEKRVVYVLAHNSYFIIFYAINVRKGAEK